MEILLGRIPGVCVFLDDVLVTAEDDATHLERLHEVLTRMKDRRLRLVKKKCLFMQDKVDYLGHTVSGSGISTMSKKVQAVQEAPVPKNVSELRSFLGLVNYYGHFVPKLSTILKPLMLLLHEDVLWNWSPECDRRFQELKGILSRAPVLAHYDPELPLILSCDASPVGVGAVLAHVYPDKTERRIAYASRTLARAEENYAQLD